MKTGLTILIPLLSWGMAAADDAVGQLSKHLEKTPALVVVVCGGDERDLGTVVGLVEQTPWTVFCRGPASAGLDRIRHWAQARGLLGGRVCVVADAGQSLWLAGDLADAVWVEPGVKDPPPEKEILRVLHAGGVYMVAGRSAVKPAQENVDEWRHPYHGPDNNVVSRDSVARLPGELRFQTYPVFAAMPNQTLFAGGRIFFFSGHIAFHQREEPLLNTLTVLNAYNGLRLWSRPLHPSYVVHNFTKLATDREVVFAEGGLSGCWTPRRARSVADSPSRRRQPLPATRTGSGLSRRRTGFGRRSARRTARWLPIGRKGKWGTGRGMLRTLSTAASSSDSVRPDDWQPLNIPR